MPTKRPDQLPEGEDFDFDDILMVEKDPDSSDRKLYKTTLRELMEAALKIDPQRMGNNAIVGTQSEFEWLIEQMKKLSDSPIVNVNDYSEFDSPTKELEKSFITPTPTPTPSITPTMSSTPDFGGEPQPSPSVTPTVTPSASFKPASKIVTLRVEGFRSAIFEIPPSYLPEIHGYSNWNLKNGEDTDNIYFLFSGFFPKSFAPSPMNEKLLTLRKLNETQIKLEVVILSDSGSIESVQGLKDQSTIEINIIYS